MTVAELRKALEGVRDDLVVLISESDSPFPFEPDEAKVRRRCDLYGADKEDGDAPALVIS